jgi:hypothetical protein
LLAVFGQIFVQSRVAMLDISALAFNLFPITAYVQELDLIGAPKP